MVVLVPLSALLIVLTVVWPAARRRLGVITPLVTLVAVAFVPLTTSAGGWLQDHVPQTPQLRRHVELGDSLTVWAGLMFVATALYWLVPVAVARGWRVPRFSTARWVQPAVGVVAVVLAVVSVVQVYRIGDSGAKAAWHGRLVTSSEPNG